MKQQQQVPDYLLFPFSSIGSTSSAYFFSSSALQLWWSLGFLNNIIPFKAILDLFCPFYKFHLLQVIPDVIFPSGLRPSHWSICKWFAFVHFPYNTGYRHSIHVSEPTQSSGFNIIYYVPKIY